MKPSFFISFILYGMAGAGTVRAAQIVLGRDMSWLEKVEMILTWPITVTAALIYKLMTI